MVTGTELTSDERRRARDRELMDERRRSCGCRWPSRDRLVGAWLKYSPGESRSSADTRQLHFRK